MTYYIDGSKTTPAFAKAYLAMRAEQTGYEQETWSAAWRSAGRSEESREFVNEISGYTLEIVAD